MRYQKLVRTPLACLRARPRLQGWDRRGGINREILANREEFQKLASMPRSGHWVHAVRFSRVRKRSIGPILSAEKQDER
jgi:hypothetical protein